MLEFKTNQPIRDLSGKISFNELLQIARSHIINPDFERAEIWCPLKSELGIDEQHIIARTGATGIYVKPEADKNRDGLLGSLFPLKSYSICIQNPQQLPKVITLGKSAPATFPETIFVRNSGGVEFVEISLRERFAVVNEQYIPQLEKLGFTCRVAEAPHAAIEGFFRMLQGESFPDFGKVG